jgi:DNA repair exonuclease SbcCD nuclease subunit
MLSYRAKATDSPDQDRWYKVTTFRFIHAADIHLDSPLVGLAGQEGPAAERIRTATRRAFEGLVDEVVERQVDFLVVAGDLYDGDWRDFNTGLFFVRQMGRLREAGVRAFVLAGNHDAESQITKALPLPENVRMFSSRRAETIELPELGVALHGRSFPERAVTENLVPTYPVPVPGRFNVGVLHTALAGAEGHLSYAPCSLGELVAKGYGYWALGHVHRRQILNEHPHVVFPGNLQGRHIRETGAKGAALVTVEEGVVTALEWIETDVVRWQLIELPLEGCRTLAEVEDRQRSALERAAAEADERLLACRLRLTGRSALHGQLLGSWATLLADARATALGLGEEAVWIEKVDVATQPAATTGDALGDLDRFLTETACDPAFLADLEANLGPLLSKLPPELRAATDDAFLTAALKGTDGDLADLAKGWLAARLAQEA